MGIVFRQSAKTSIVVFTGAALGAAVIWLSTKYIADKHQFGFIQNLTNNAVVIAQTLLFGLNSTLAFYVHHFDDVRKKKLLLVLCTAFPTALFLIFTALYYCFRTRIIGHFQPEDMPYISRYFSWLPPYILLFIYQMMLEQYLSSQMKVAAAAFVREVVLRIANIALIIAFGIGLISFDVLVGGTVLAYLIPVFIFLVLSLRTEAFGLTFNKKLLSRAEYVEIIHFSWYHFLLIVALVLMNSMDILLLPFYDHTGFQAVAIYRIPVFIISFLQLPLKALTQPIVPGLATAFIDKNYAAAKNIFSRSSINIFLATVPIGLIICCNISNAVVIIHNGYSDMVPVFYILFIGSIVNVATGVNDLVLSVAKYYQFNFYLSFVLITVLFILIRVLVPHYGIYGAAWSTTIVVSLFNALKCWFIWKKLGMQPFSRGTLMVIVAALPALAVGYLLPHFFDQTRHIYVRTFLDATLRSAVIIVVYLAMLLWLKPSPDLQEYLATIKRNKRLF